MGELRRQRPVRGHQGTCGQREGPRGGGARYPGVPAGDGESIPGGLEPFLPACRSLQPHGGGDWEVVGKKR